MFNEDQKDAMAFLSTLAPEEKCYCGWEREGQCYNCKRDPQRAGKTSADKIAESDPAQNQRHDQKVSDRK